MDIALLINCLRENPDIRNVLLRPFADSSLLEIAVEKLSMLDAPCKKYVAVAGKDVRSVVSQFGGLSMLKCSPEQGSPNAPLDVEFAHIKNIPESWVLVIDPCSPLVQAEQWWQAVEAFLANEPRGLVSATRVRSHFFDDEGRSIRAWNERPGEMLVRNDAFKIVQRDALFTEKRYWSARSQPPVPFEIPRTNAHAVVEMEDLTAIEAVYSMVQLGFPA